MTIAYNPTIVTSGLLFLVDAGNVKSYSGSGTAWNDLSRNNLGGTLANSPTFNTANGGSFLFNGTNQTCSTSLSLASARAFTIETWVKTSTFNREVIATYGSGNVFEFFITASGYIGVYAYGGGTTYRTSSILIADGNWHQLVGTYNGGTGELSTYVDGVLANGALVGSVPAVLNSGGGNAVIANVNAGSYYFAGNIAKIGVYNVTLPAASILNNYIATRSRFGLS